MQNINLKCDTLHATVIIRNSRQHQSLAKINYLSMKDIACLALLDCIPLVICWHKHLGHSETLAEILWKH
jgi:hypothetical protein